MGYVPLSSEHIPNRGIEEWTSILVDYVYQLVGDPEAVEQLVAGVLANKALSTLSLGAAEAYLQALTDATDSACNYLLLRDEADRLPSLPYRYAITGTPEHMAEDSIARAARKLHVLKRAALALSDQLNLDVAQVAQVLRQPADQTARFVPEARQEYAEQLDEIVHLRGQLPLASIAPAIALGLRPRYGYARSAFALLPPFELPAERLELLKWNALKNQEPIPARTALPRPLPRLPLAWNRALQPALFLGALAALMWGAWVLGRLSAATSAPAAMVLVVTATPTATRGIVALPVPATATPTATASPLRVPTQTPTLVPLESATPTETPGMPSGPDATPAADETDEPDVPLSPTGTSTPRLVRRIVVRPTSTPTRIIYAAVPTRTPTRAPTRTPTPLVPTPLPTPTASATPAPTATPTQALPSATPLKPPAPTATTKPPTATPTNVPPTVTPTKTPLPPTPTLTPTKALAAATPTKTIAPPATKPPTVTPTLKP